jgi:U2 small nuclear ribonucleoprotein B''
MSNVGVEPNATLYIKNIDWKIKKGLLRRALYSLFTRHGKVLDIITLRKDGLRGQAFVIMENIHAATAALQAEQGLTFFNKDMVIEYAHTKSDVIAKRDGDYIPKAQRLLQKKQKRQMNMIITEDNTSTTEVISTVVDDIIPTISTTIEIQIQKDDIASIQQSLSTTPTTTLVAYQLPIECNEIMLHILFQQYIGYQPPVRMIVNSITTTITTDPNSTDTQHPPPYGIIEFDTDSNAIIAYNALNGFQLSTKETLQLIYMLTLNKKKN